MPADHSHAWPTTTAEAIVIQEQLRSQIIAEDQLGPIRHVAGVDCGFEHDGTITRAAVAVLSFPDLQLRDQAVVRRPTTFPYIPGFLSFREIPAVLDALAELTIQPDLLLCDGQGLAHPRRLGIACHLGLLADIPAIGCAKSLLIGKHDPLPDERGAWRALHDRGDVVGAVLRTRAGTKPLYISIGHRISLPTAIDYVMRCTPKYRLPETTRQAHHLASD
jgi:deoxyribonuclease V